MKWQYSFPLRVQVPMPRSRLCILLSFDILIALIYIAVPVVPYTHAVQLCEEHLPIYKRRPIDRPGRPQQLSYILSCRCREYGGQ